MDRDAPSPSQREVLLAAVERLEREKAAERDAYEATIERLETEIRTAHTELADLRDDAAVAAAGSGPGLREQCDAELATMGGQLETCNNGLLAALGLTRSADQAARIRRPPTAPTPSPPPATANLGVVGIDAQPTEKNNTWWRYSWLMTVVNGGPHPVDFRAEIELLDQRNFIVDDDTEYLTIRGSQRDTFTGSILVDAAIAPNVISVRAELYPR